MFQRSPWLCRFAGALAQDCCMSRKRQQSLLHVMQLMQLMQLLQIPLANSLSSPYIMLTCARNHVQNIDYPGFSSKVYYK